MAAGVGSQIEGGPSVLAQEAQRVGGKLGQRYGGYVCTATLPSCTPGSGLDALRLCTQERFVSERDEGSDNMELPCMFRMCSEVDVNTCRSCEAVVRKVVGDGVWSKSRWRR